MSPRTKFILIIFLAAVAFFLAIKHKVHLYGIIPYLFVLLMIPLHLLMHSSHGNHDNSKKIKKDGHHGKT